MGLKLGNGMDRVIWCKMTYNGMILEGREVEKQPFFFRFPSSMKICAMIDSLLLDRIVIQVTIF